MNSIGVTGYKMCIHIAVLWKICRSSSSVDVDSILVGHNICNEI